MALMLLNMGAEAGGRLDPQRFERRRPDSSSRRAFDLCLRERWIDAADNYADTLVANGMPWPVAVGNVVSAAVSHFALRQEQP